MFLHEDPDFQDLVAITADKVGLDRALVEKDYWVTHTLWALHRGGLEVWFKGGTSLSKGFGIIERFSEDLDLQIERGEATDLPDVTSWKNKTTRAISTRTDFFTRLPLAVDLPGGLELQDDGFDPRNSRADYRFYYPGLHLDALPKGLSGFILLELGRATVTPCLKKPMTSFVHRHALELNAMGDLTDNQPNEVRCLHPIMTLVEKIVAIHKGIRNENAPETYVRHFEDAARIIAREESLPSLTDREFEQLKSKHLAGLAPSSDSFLLPPGDHLHELERAHAGMGSMFWGERIPIDDCREQIQQWVERSRQ